MEQVLLKQRSRDSMAHGSMTYVKEKAKRKFLVNIAAKIKTVETTFQNFLLREFGEKTRLMVSQFIDKEKRFRMWYIRTGYASLILTRRAKSQKIRCHLYLHFRRS